jgi:N6-adenosine-specific RNA methylase IME4
MDIEAICALPVQEVTTDDCILFLWVTPPLVAHAVRVVDAWGFRFRTSMVWVKDKLGMGHWVRQRHELLFIAIRGNMLTPPEAARPDSVIEAPRRAHSEKPHEVYELIERMYPELPKLELFARTPRPGWSAWGNQVPCSASLDELEALEVAA